MVGLTESRCPECGTVYTLDELIARQGFAAVPPAPPVAPKEPAGPTLRSA
jgi:rRNA maturation protein Nop10